MKIMVKTLVLFALCLFTANVQFAQNNAEILNNDKIIDLVKIGLDADIIVEKIRQSECQCQTDTNSLAKLKAAKVPNSVIMAMLNATSKSNQPNQTTTNSNSLPKTNTKQEKTLFSNLKEPGIYVNDNGELKLIEPSVFSGTKTNPLLGAVTYGLKKTKIKATVRGKNANLIITNVNPEFYFVFNPELRDSGATMGGLFWGLNATSPAEFMLVEMKVKDSKREAVIGEYGLISGASTGAADKDIREYTFEKLKPGIYKVKLKQNLSIGEYCFYFASEVAGVGVGGGKIFDFSIANEK
jgi:hypothetical protein